MPRLLIYAKKKYTDYSGIFWKGITKLGNEQKR
jgi:hypothetical protein